MKYFITGTDTNVGKTLISAWLCLHTGFSYFKPIQTGAETERDIDTLLNLTPQTDCTKGLQFQEALSPHEAACRENRVIDYRKIPLPDAPNLVIEGAGGVLVPLNKWELMIDYIVFLNIPVLIVARSTLGTINHTLLTLQALRARHIPIAGMILNGPSNPHNTHAIENYGKVRVLAEFPVLSEVTHATLSSVPLPTALKNIF